MSAPSNRSPKDLFAVALETEDLKKLSLRGSFVTALSQGAKTAIQLGSQIVLARLLFPSDFGLLAMISPIIGFVLVFNDIGLGQAIVQRPVLMQDQVSALFWINLVLSCALACIVMLAAPLVAWAYGEPRVLDPMIVLSTLIPVAALGINPTAILSRQMRFGWMAFSEVSATLIGVVVAAFCAWRGWSYWSLVAGQFANSLIGSALSWAICGWYPSRPKYVRSVWADLKFGGNLTGANLATFLITSADNVIVGIMTGPSALGLYDRSYRLVIQPLGQMLAPISRVALPLLSRLNNRPGAYRSAYLKIFDMLLLITVPGLLVCIVNGEIIIRVFLGSRWSDAAPIFSWICVGGLTSGIYSSSSWLFISQGRTRELRQFTVAAAFINVASFVLGAFWGIIGVAVAGATSFVLVATPLMLYGATRSGPLHVGDLVRAGGPFVFRSAIVFAMLIVGKSYMAAGGLGQIIFATLTSYLAFLSLSLLSRDGRRSLRDVIGMLLILRRT